MKLWRYEMRRVGQNRKYTPYMIVYLVISLPKLPYIHRVYIVLVNPRNACCRERALMFAAPWNDEGERSGNP